MNNRDLLLALVEVIAVDGHGREHDVVAVKLSQENYTLFVELRVLPR